MNEDIFEKTIINAINTSDFNIDYLNNLLADHSKEIQKYYNTYFKCCEYAMKTNVKKAIIVWDYYNRNIKKHPGVMSRLITAFISTKQFQEAKNTFAEFLEIFPNHEYVANKKYIIDTEINKNYKIVITSKNNKIIFCDSNKSRLDFNGKCKNIIDYELSFYVADTLNADTAKQCNEVKCLKIIDENFKKTDNITTKIIVIKVNLLTCKEIEIFEKNDNIFDIINIQTQLIRNFVEGYNGFLFLANDTNQSIEQFTGKKLLNDNILIMWKKFFDSFSVIKNSLFLITPSKESVYPQYYPYKRGKLTSIDQLIKIDKHRKILYPVELLKNTNMSYSTIDTHWTEYGAYIVYKKILDMFYIQDNSDFKFVEKDIYGDLGSKTHPLRLGKYLFLDKFNENKNLVFTNFLTNTGELKIYQNNDYVIDKTVFLSGSSFLYHLRKFFIRTFRRIIVLRSPTILYIDFVNYENPDLVICETTERFIFVPPIILKSNSGNGEIYNSDIDKEIIKKIMNIKYDNKDLYLLYLNRYKTILANAGNDKN